MNYMKFITLLALLSLVFLGACNSDDGGARDLSGEVSLKFENIPAIGTNLSLATPGSTNYTYTNPMGQGYNVTVLKYIISEIRLEGPDGERFDDLLEVTADDAKGYYLVDQANIGSSGRMTLQEVPAGTYNQIRFIVGVEESGVTEGAAGGALSQGAGARDADMFWNWNVGYQALKLEGFSEASPVDGVSAQAFGESIAETDEKAFAFHIGGWDNPNNNKEIVLAIDEITVNATTENEIHLVMDLSELLGATNQVDFSQTFNVHSPAAGAAIADNIRAAFKFDHIHN